MVRRCAALAMAAMLTLVSAGLSQAADTPPEAFGEVTFEMPEGGAYAQEMVTMVVRFYFKVRATTERLEQPDLDELGWTQLGRDTWAPTKIGSANWFGFERRIAVFAPEAKTYTIPPFTHHLTLIDAQGVRWTVDALSKPVELAIRPWTGTTDGPEDEGTWWLPARSLEVKDSWSIDPGTLGAGQTTRRRVEVSAVGVPAEQLPPMIEMQSPGLIVFPGPVERRTEIVEGVPVGHAAYSYDIRPHTGDPTILKEVLIPWFDTQARAMRQSIVPGASVGQGMVIPGQAIDDSRMSESGPSKFIIGAASGAAAFLLGVLVLLLPGSRDRVPVASRLMTVLAELRRTLAVRRAAWLGRPEELRSALYRLAREDGPTGSRWLGHASVRDSLADLDRALFARREDGQSRGTAGGRNLSGLASALLLVRRDVLRIHGQAEPQTAAGLSPFGR